MQEFIKTKRFWTGFAGVVASVALAGLVASSALNAAATKTDPTDANIARVTAGLLEHSQFSHRRLDAELAAKFLDRYLDSLDPSHQLFLQAEVLAFESIAPRLPEMTRRDGDLTPARTIFQKYVSRVEQRTEFATNLLAHETFEFTGNETYSFDREKAVRPTDLDAARKLWRQNVRADYLQEKLSGKKAEDIVATLTRRYSRMLQSTRKLDPDDVLAVYLNALAHVYDPHSDYFGREEMDDFSIAMNLSLFGVGATLRSDDGYCEVFELVPGGPAAKSGLLKPGDRIVAVAQGDEKPVDVVEMPLPDAVKLIRGPKGSPVRLTLIPAGSVDDSKRRTVTIVRDEVKLEDQQAKARIVDWPQTNGPALRLGVIDLPSFYGGFNGKTGATVSSASADVAKLVRKLKTEDIEGLVLDLRRNGGGSLEEAIDLTGLFIRQGPVVQTREPDGRTDVGADTDPAELYDGPLIVLTSRFSASASEILAGALQDYGRAIIVGDTSTFGKGTVQSVVPLERVMDANGLAHTTDPGALKVTIRKFYRPSGASTQLKGVAADIVLPSLSDVSGVGESELKDPLPWDRVDASDFSREDHVGPFVSPLRDRSVSRVAGDPEFAYVREDIAELKKSLAAKSVSLNEADRRRERDSVKAREAARKKEREARHVAAPTSYEITVQNADKPGLPAPMELETEPEPKSADAGPEDQSEPDSQDAKHDPVLKETERIMVDYLGLLHRPRPVASVGR